MLKTSEKEAIKIKIRRIKVKAHHIKAHTIHRHGKTIHVKAHHVKAYIRHDKRFKVKGHSGERFHKLEKEVERGYEEKGMSKAEAERIGKATAGKVFWRKYGKKEGSKILRRER